MEIMSFFFTSVGLLDGGGCLEGIVGRRLGGCFRNDADVGVEGEELRGFGTVDVEVPVADKILLVEQSAVGAEEGGFAVVVAHVEHLTAGFNVGVVSAGELTAAAETGVWNAGKNRVVDVGSARNLTAHHLHSGRAVAIRRGRQRCIRGGSAVAAAAAAAATGTAGTASSTGSTGHLGTAVGGSTIGGSAGGGSAAERGS